MWRFLEDLVDDITMWLSKHKVDTSNKIFLVLDENKMEHPDFAWWRSNLPQDWEIDTDKFLQEFEELPIKKDVDSTLWW